MPEIIPLTPNDLPALSRLFARNFPRRDETRWLYHLQTIAARPKVAGTPEIGYGLLDGELHGAVLTISSLHGEALNRRTITNISTWCADASHRGKLAKELYACAGTGDGITFSNLSAAIHTLKTITALGFRPWSEGQFVGFGVTTKASRARIISGVDVQRLPLGEWHLAMLAEHERAGCVVLVLENGEGYHPLVFLRRRIRKVIPCAQLIYCRDLETLTNNSLLVSTKLATRGLPLVMLDSNGPVPGYRGKFFAGRAAKYYKGPFPEAAVDHTYSEMVYIGF